MPGVPGKLPAKPLVRHPCVNVLVSPRKQVTSQWPLLNKIKRKLPWEQMAGDAQMRHWRQREHIRSLYVTELSFPWHFGDLQSHFLVFPPFHLVPSAMLPAHAPLFLWNAEQGRWRSGCSEDWEAWVQLLSRTASRQCSSVYSVDNRIEAIRLINVMLSESRISPPMEKQEDS